MAHPQEQKAPRIEVLSQYIKDMSFENPKAPMSLTLEETPKAEVALDVDVLPIEEEGDNLYEVTLAIKVHTTGGEHTMFIIDLEYCGVFMIEAEDEGLKELLLCVQAPQLLFPYARQIISTTVASAGLPPFNLSPVDFMGNFLNSQSADDEGEVPKKVVNKNIN
jgi:preprotein translocase subunit SecB